MAQTGYSPIQLYYSTTASAAPVAGNLNSGELAINITDGKLYYKDNAGSVQLLSTSTTANGTANGVLYLNGSKVATSGSALTFDGTNLGLGGTPNSYGSTTTLTVTGTSYSEIDFKAGSTLQGHIAGGGSSLEIGTDGAFPLLFKINGSEQMRLTSTGLGIGTSSPSYSLHVLKNQNGSTLIAVDNQWGTSGANAGLTFITADVAGSSTSTFTLQKYKSGAGIIANNETNSAAYMGFTVGSSERMRIDSSGNLGLGTTLQKGTKLNVMGGDIVPATSGSTQNGGLRVSSLSSGSGGYVLDMGVSNTNGYAWMQVSNSADLSGPYTKDLVLQPNGGNLGLGVTPSAWSTVTALQIKNASVYGYTTSETGVNQNAYYGSANWRYISTAAATAYRQISGAHSWHIAASGTAGDPITFTQAMTLDASGRLGVGTTSPTQRLHVYQSGGANILLDNGGASTTYFATDGFASGVSSIYTNGSAPLAFGTNSTERARIDSSGNFLVGTTTQTGTFNVTYTGTSQPVSYVYASDSSFTNAVVRASMAGTSSSAQLFLGQNSNNNAVFYVQGNGVINSTSTSITAISDQNLKENIRDIETGLDSILALKPRRYDWKEGKGQDKKNVAGFIAQEFEQVFPDSVGKSLAADDGIEYKNINYETLVPTLVKAIQEQQALIETLTSRVASLESK